MQFSKTFSYLSKTSILIVLFVPIILILSTCKRDAPINSDTVGPLPLTEQNKTVDTTLEYAYHEQLAVNDINVKLLSKKSPTISNLAVIVEDSTSNKHYQINIQYDGELAKAQQGDLNKDGYKEIYIFNTSNGSGSYGIVFGYQITPAGIDTIQMKELNEEQLEKYMGHDKFELTPDMLIRQFPLFNEMDPNCCPTGGIMEIKYHLTKIDKHLWLVPENLIQ